MADTVTTQVIQNGARDYVAKFTDVSDGTGESGVVKLNASSGGDMGVIIGGQTFYPTTHLVIRRIWYDIQGMKVRMRWEASSDVDMFILGGFDDLDFSKFNGLPNPKTAGSTGSVKFTTVGAGANATYSIVIWAQKNIVTG